jgi:hypothetical protein
MPRNPRPRKNQLVQGMSLEGVLPVQGCKSLPSAGTASLRFPDRTGTWTVPHLYDTDETGHSRTARYELNR